MHHCWLLARKGWSCGCLILSFPFFFFFQHGLIFYWSWHLSLHRYQLAIFTSIFLRRFILNEEDFEESEIKATIIYHNKISICRDDNACGKAAYFVVDSSHNEVTFPAKSIDREKFVAQSSLKNFISDAPNPQCFKYVEMQEDGQ